jgi:lipid-A-disaccharide synthase
VYKTSWPTYLLGRLLVRLPFIGLVNIVAGKEVVPEFIQDRMTPENLVAAVKRILGDEAYAAGMRAGLSVIKAKLGSAGASARVAAGIIALGEST